MLIKCTQCSNVLTNACYSVAYNYTYTTNMSPVRLHMTLGWSFDSVTFTPISANIYMKTLSKQVGEEVTANIRKNKLNSSILAEINPHPNQNFGLRPVFKLYCCINCYLLLGDEQVIQFIRNFIKHGNSLGSMTMDEVVYIRTLFNKYFKVPVINEENANITCAYEKLFDAQNLTLTEINRHYNTACSINLSKLTTKELMEINVMSGATL